tara:strand:- start:12 stop:368 length:357 start_codon:yes stop_codon:yes gene_type:complete
MSQPLACTALKIATVWPVLSKDPYGQATFGAPYLINCTIEQGSNRQYRNAQGTLYIPASIYWYEFGANGLPSLNDYIAPGDNLISATPTGVDGVELIKNRVRQDNSILGDTDDLMVLT